MAATGAELLASLLKHLDGQYADRFAGEWLAALDGCVLLTADEARNMGVLIATLESLAKWRSPDGDSSLAVADAYRLLVEIDGLRRHGGDWIVEGCRKELDVVRAELASAEQTLDEWHEERQQLQTRWDGLKADRDAARAEAARERELHHKYSQMCGDLKLEYAVARAEADRLREALKWIANRYRNDDDNEARDIAREALAGAGGETPK